MFFKKLKQEKKQLEIAITSSEKELLSIQKQITNGQDELRRLKAEIGECEGIIELEDLGLPFDINSLSSSVLDESIERTEKELSRLVHFDNALTITKQYKIDGSFEKGEKFQKIYCDNILMNFNNYLNKKIKSVTEENYNKTIELIKKKFHSMNSKGKILGIALNDKYLELSIKLTEYKLRKKIKESEEKEKIKQEKQAMREQQKLLEEAEKEKKRLEELKKSMDIAFAKALTDEERANIQAEINSIDKRLGDIDYRISNPMAGWLYIIESDSLPGMVKIGVSRRLNGPMERIRELSSSSLPWPFRLCGFCFSDNAFELESNMHKYFEKQRVSPNKEFFNISPKEAINILSNHFHQEVHFSDMEEKE